MGRKTQVAKTDMLNVGLKMIIDGKYNTLTIKSLAEEIGCSTQPIAWSFGNIDNYRAELRQYAIKYMQNKISGGDGISNHSETGYRYINMAVDEPDLIRYLRSDEKSLRESGGIGFIFDEEKNSERKKMWAKALNLSETQAAEFMDFSVIYTEGIVSMILSGVIAPDREKAHKMFTDAATAFIKHLLTESEEKKWKTS